MVDSSTDPGVTLLIPTLDEAANIDRCLGSVAAQTYPAARMHVLVLDGGSEDDTVARAAAWQDRIPGLEIVPNPDRIQAAALNLGLERSRHEVIVRMDAHTEYAEDYVERSVATLLGSEATVVGGPMRPRGTTRFGDAVAVATTTPFGVGPGRFHYSEEREFVDTVYLGTFRRRAIEDVGGYDPDFAIGEDHELNFRITQSGGRILLDPTIVSWYQPRNSARTLWKQYLRYGRAKIDTMRKHGRLPTWRPLAPAALVAGVPLTIAGLGTPIGAWSLLPWAGYGAAVGFVAVAKGGSNAPRVAAAIVIMHSAYGIGFWQRLAEIRLARTRKPH